MFGSSSLSSRGLRSWSARGTILLQRDGTRLRLDVEASHILGGMCGPTSLLGEVCGSPSASRLRHDKVCIETA
jgi:hypothetical protein